MKYVFFTNGRVGLELLRWLSSQGDSPTGLVVHPPERGRLRSEIIHASRLRAGAILEGQQLDTRDGIQWLRALQPDWLISVSFGYILRDAVLRVPTRGALNLHPALLPFNRGAYPNVWTIIEKTPAGATLHFIDEGLDTGDIVAQVETAVGPADTGATLYEKLEDASIQLFKEQWPAIKDGRIQRRAQTGEGTSHRKADVERIDRIDPKRTYRAQDLIDILRARTFPPCRGAYLDLGDRRIYLQLELVEAAGPFERQ